MAGGIDWFRWHHGSVSDGKFALVAHKAGASVAEVIAVWACLLEAASAAEDRGNPGPIDFEAMDFSLGLTEGKAWLIYERMQERALLDGESGRIASWEKRQPKRERTDDNSTERSRAFRQKQRQEEPCNATQRQETPRGEESREEDSVAKATDGKPSPGGSKSPEDMARAELWTAAVSVLEAGGCPKSQCRTFVGKLVGDYGADIVRGAVEAAVTAQPADAREYIKAACMRAKGQRRDPITVPSDGPQRTAEYLASQVRTPAEKAAAREAAAKALAAIKGVTA